MADELTVLEDKVFASMLTYSKKFYLLLGILIPLLAFGAYGYIIQLSQGLVVTGLSNIVSWGFYLSAFIYFIGISYGGILISGILRITGAEWRRPITRIAEVITVFSLGVGASMILLDMGRPERVIFVFMYGRIESPILWDMLSITTYLVGSLLYLYLPLIPDIAICRDRLVNVSWFRKRIYKMLSLGWRGSPEQRNILEKAMKIMAVIMIPVAISVHTIVGWIFGMTLRPGWHSTIFGPLFVTGAIFTGVACIIIAMALLRKTYHLEDYFTDEHFNKMGLLLLTLALAIIYMNVSEYLTVWYGGEEAEIPIIDSKFNTTYAYMFWGMVIGGFIAPAVILAFKKGRTVVGAVVAAVLVNIGMFTERYLIVIPTMVNPILPYDEVGYTPTWVEISIILAGFSAIILGVMVFIKIFPLISIWEMKEGMEQEKEEELKYDKPPEERHLVGEKKPFEVEEMEGIFND